jgi:hypothetical protein
MDKVAGVPGDDIIVSETAAGLYRLDRQTLALFVVSLFGIHNANGQLLNGDALVVRPRGTTETALLAAVLGCSETHVPVLLAGTGSWSTREITQIDGHRLRFDPD